MKYELFLKNLKITDAKVFYDYDIKNLTSFKIGGKAKYFVIVKNTKTLIKLLKHCKKYFILGGGTNVLFSDKNYNGTIIKLEGSFKKIRVTKNYITCGSGASLFEINKIAKNNSLSGIEFSYGIPGTIGGAIFGNAGAFDDEILNYVTEVKILKNNKVFWTKNFSHSYRKSCFQDDNSIILSAKIMLNYGNKNLIDAMQKANLLKRINSQPYGKPCAGSVFKREINDGKIIFPAKIIDTLGLKGVTIGGAMISTKHAGFIVNGNNAKFKDVIKLIKHVKKIVYKNYNLKLKEEIIIVGGKANAYFGRFPHPFKIFKTKPRQRNNS